MNKAEYVKFQEAIERNLHGLDFVSTGACSGCAECGLDEDCTEREREQAEESSFSWAPCDSCGSRLGGDRHPAHGRDKDGNLIHFSVCVDCLYFLNYGQLDDMSMMEMESK